MHFSLNPSNSVLVCEDGHQQGASVTVIIQRSLKRDRTMIMDSEISKWNALYNFNVSSLLFL